MKASSFFMWAVNANIDCKELNFLEVHEEGDESWEQNETWWLNHVGSLPPAPIPAGTYVYYYANEFSGTEPMDECGCFADYYEIELPTPNNFDYIRLYLVEA